MLKNLNQMQSHADYDKSAMETGDHSKNGASPKSLMSKRNLMKFAFFALTMLAGLTAKAQTFSIVGSFDNEEDSPVILTFDLTSSRIIAADAMMQCL
jgi:hypothetical protein